MKNTFQLYKQNNGPFLSAFALIWFVFLLIALEYSKANAHYLLNSFHAPFLDVFFKYFTYIGGGFPVYLGIAWVLFNKRQGLYILLTQGVTAIFTQIAKYSFAHPRPLTYFREIGLPLPPTVDGVQVWDAYHSFPSGHTSATFALCACLAAITPPKYRWLQLVWVVLGWLGAYSRIYLSQHFVDDVLLGSIIGVGCAGFLFVVLFQKTWGDAPLFSFKKK
ncbi:MAG: phosphatase PAP2 family protein [Paludibacteraceae bacterium]|nr:phosphatase PAP2 family protein [Paludibacteraceae bacterium]